MLRRRSSPSCFRKWCRRVRSRTRRPAPGSATRCIPLLVSLPIGAWTSATVLDLASWEGFVDGGAPAGRARAAGGAADRDRRRVGLERHRWAPNVASDLVHAAGAWLSMGLYAASWRARGVPRAPRWNAVRARGVERAGRHRIPRRAPVVRATASGSTPPPSRAVPRSGRTWRPTTRSPRARPSRSGWMVSRSAHARGGGTLFAIADRCTHRGGPLSEGELQGDCVVCPWHGSAFRLGGWRRQARTRHHAAADIRHKGMSRTDRHAPDGRTFAAQQPNLTARQTPPGAAL